MKIKATKEILNQDVLVLGVFENDLKINVNLDSKTKKLINDFVIKEEGFKGKFLDSYLLVNPNLKIKKILILGLGKKDKFTLNNAREISAFAIKKVEKMLNVKNVVFEIPNNNSKNCTKEMFETAMLDGILAGSYKFDKYKTKKEKEKPLNIEILDGDKKVIDRAIIVNDSLTLAKDLINEQAAVLTPDEMSKIATKLAKENNLTIKVYSKAQIEKMNMGAYLAVSKGSDNEPKFVHIKYSPKSAKKKIALIGKGITFDSGGLDIKPSASMMDMKDDMSGAACVISTILAVSKLKPNVEVHAICALCENMPSGHAYKQGDVLTASNGVTIEVDNTDAEGRLTLADALCYADKLNVDEIIDVATLTGACIVALGNKIAGIMGTNNKMIKDLIETADISGEKLWQMPMTDDMMDNLKSNIADMRNTGGREAGTSTAGKFLSNFVKNKNWAHIDIAGTAHISKPYRELSTGATGSMVKTFINYVCR